MSAINVANLKRTFYYLRRNGLRRTWYAVKERLEEGKAAPYTFAPVPEEELAGQRAVAGERLERGDFTPVISIVVPTYRTNPLYLREMIESVKAQTYPCWELILADATEDESVAAVAAEYEDAGSIHYIRLSENRGISENTNAALEHVRGDYVGLLDHDDVLTENALFEVAEQIIKAREQGSESWMLYSDEDKCNENRSQYYEPNRKEKFNLDLIFSNNYICHFLVMKSQMIKELGFRSDYDGAQDYDLVLRAVEKLHLLQNPRGERQIVYIPRVLYHWRCHSGSTAENPRSKQYAYDAGRRALKDFVDRNGLDGDVISLGHVGFYQIRYEKSPLLARGDLGVVGGRILCQGKIAGGRMDEAGNVFYEGLPQGYSGYLHRAVLTQDADAVDLRCMMVREELMELFRQIVGVPYQCAEGKGYFDISTLPEDADIKDLSLKFCRAVRKRGYRILWLPEISVEVKNG